MSKVEYSLPEIVGGIGAILTTAGLTSAGAWKVLRSAKGTTEAPSVVELSQKDRDMISSITKLDNDMQEHLGALTDSNQLTNLAIENLSNAVNTLIPEIRESNRIIGLVFDRTPRTPS